MLARRKVGCMEIGKRDKRKTRGGFDEGNKTRRISGGEKGKLGDDNSRRA